MLLSAAGMDALIVAAITGFISVVGTWGALKLELRYHRRDIDRAQDTADGAHERIDAIPGAPPRRRHTDYSLARAREP